MLLLGFNRQNGFWTLGGEEELKDKIHPQIAQITQILEIGQIKWTTGDKQSLWFEGQKKQPHEGNRLLKTQPLALVGVLRQKSVLKTI